MVGTGVTTGFTLIELAVVLVIVGLIVGGVLIGQDMIRSAGISGFVNQLGKYNAAAATFRTKYKNTPGDLMEAQAQQLNFAPTTRSGADGEGDGDGVIENGATNKQGLGFETRAFWADLSQANLIGEEIYPPVPFGITGYANAGALKSANVLPGSKLRAQTHVHIFPIRGRMFYYVGGIDVVDGTTGLLTLAPAVTPTEADTIDRKMDDGKGNDGIVRAISSVVTNAVDNGSAGTAAYGESVDCFSAAGVYNTTKAHGMNVNCMLSIRTQF